MGPYTTRLSMTETAPRSLAVALFLCALLVAGSLLQLAATDLILPAIPSLPDMLGGDAATSQFVLASYIAGTAIGLLAFGAAGARFGRRRLLVISAFVFAAVSWRAAGAATIDTLIGWRLVQGFVAAAPAVYAPGIIRALFSESGATKAIGALGSVESLAPAIGPIIGVWLLSLGGWTLSFHVTAIAALVLGILLLVFFRLLPPTEPPPEHGGSYLRLLRSPVYLRYALSQACVVGGLLVFVFGAPVVIVRTMGGALDDFIIMQVTGVTCFIVASNTTGFFVDRFGAERMIAFGTGMAALAALGLLAYALSGGGDPFMLAFLFAPMNAGLGFRGPPGFLRALIASAGDNDRGASLMILAILGVAAGGTALLAPFVLSGLATLCATVTLIQLTAVGLLVAIKPLEMPPS